LGKGGHAGSMGLCFPNKGRVAVKISAIQNHRGLTQFNGGEGVNQLPTPHPSQVHWGCSAMTVIRGLWQGQPERGNRLRPTIKKKMSTFFEFHRVADLMGLCGGVFVP